MEQPPLTLLEMVNFNLPKNYSYYLSTLSRFAKNQNSPHNFRPKIFDNTSTTPCIKYPYIDTSQQRQKEFLQKSGKIKRRRIYALNNVNLKQSQNKPKSTSSLSNDNKIKKNNLSFEMKNRFNTPLPFKKIQQRNEQMISRSSHIKSLLAKISAIND